ncbi:glycosyltransferase [Dactylosporangium sp. CA-139066]|uniref:glycosyltransferase n=1 Tax=Dactylosporangium sp. CA-139066 TaxID=3239930 RepID=UPI003D8E9DD9
MKVLLAQNMPHAPAYGGANRSNRVMLEQLAASGHECLVVAPLLVSEDELRAHLVRHGAGDVAEDGHALTYRLRGVSVRAVTAGPRLVREVLQVAARFRPDWILVPSDDPGALMLGAAVTAAPTRVVYLAHTLQQLPFGPRAFFPSKASTRLVRRTAGIVSVSRAAQAYLARWGGMRSELIHPAVYGRGPFPVLGGEAITLVNACAYKGIDVFLGLADAFADVPFLAVASWGTGPEDLRRLRRRPNVTVIGAVDDITEVLRRCRVLLVPSLWDETFGYTAVEALLHGVPVLAGDVGGLPEAMLGQPHVLPVRPIERYEGGTVHPVAVVPEQDLGPWRETLSRLLSDEAYAQQVREASRRAAAAFVSGLDEGMLERYLRTLAPAPGRERL